MQAAQAGSSPLLDPPMGAVEVGPPRSCTHHAFLPPPLPAAQQTQVQATTPEQPPGSQAAVPGKAAQPKHPTGT